jgi:hypothetical protein
VALDESLKEEIVLAVESGLLSIDEIVDTYSFQSNKPTSPKRKAEVWKIAAAAEAVWQEKRKIFPATTDCDRLEIAFGLLRSRGVYAPFGCHTAYALNAAASDLMRMHWQGFCTFDWHNVLHCLRSRELSLNTGSFRHAARDADHLEMSSDITRILQQEGFYVKAHDRNALVLCLHDFEWQNRTSPAEAKTLIN